MLALIKKHDFYALFIVILSLFVLNIAVFLHIQPDSVTDVNSFMAPLFQLIQQNNLSLILGLTFILIQAFWLNKILFNKRYTANMGYIPAFAFIFAHSIFSHSLVFNPVLLADFILIWVFSKLLNMHNEPVSYGSLFNIGVLIAFASIIFPFYSVMLLFAIISYLNVKPFSSRELISIFIGFVVPFIWLFTALFLFDKMHWATEFKLQKIVAIKSISFNYTWSNAFRILLFIFIALSVLFTVQASYFKVKVIIRKLYMVSIFWFLCGFIIFLIKSAFNEFDLRALCIPSGLMTTYLLLNIEHPKWAEGILWTLVVLCVALTFDMKINW